MARFMVQSDARQTEPRTLLRRMEESLRHGLVLSLLLGGCTPDFKDPWLVEDLRILAVKATPPEVIVLRDSERVDPQILLSQLEPENLSVSIEVLAVDPRAPDREVEWEIWVCSSDESYCKDDSAFVERLAGGRSRLDEISYRYEPTPQQALAAFDADPLAGFGGVPITIEVRLHDEDRVVRAFKRLVFVVGLPYSPVPRCKRANRSPMLSGVAAGDNGVLGQGDRNAFAFAAGSKIVFDPMPSGERAQQRIAECPDPLAVEEPPPGVDCQEDPADESRENYWVVTADDPLQATEGEPTLGSRQLCEYLSYSFFTTAGKLSHASTGGAPSPFVENKKITDSTSEWTAPGEADAELPGGVVDFWVVIRDGRGGTNWLHFEARAQDR